MIKDLCFEVIQTCPNNCLFCSSCSGIDKKMSVDYDTFKKTIDFFMSHGGIEEISISGGEPLLHPDIFKIIRYCKKYGIRTVLFTSGIKFRKKMTDEEKRDLEHNLRIQYNSYLKEGMPLDEFELLIKKLMDRYLAYDKLPFDSLSTYDCHLLEQIGLDKIVFDFQAWNKDVYDRIMGTNNMFELVTTSIVKASQTKIETDAHFIPTKINYRELPEIIEMLNVANFGQISILNFVPQGRGDDNAMLLSLSNNEFEEFVRIFEECKDLFNGKIRVGIPLQGVDTHKCTAGLSKMVIKYDGLVLPCPAFKEYDIDVLNKIGIKTPNIYGDLNDIKVYSGTRSKPLCKQLYDFNRNISK